MPRIYSDTVAARFLNRDAAVAALRSCAESLARHDSDVSAVILFGSLARGDATPRSDADLLVLLHRSEIAWTDRIPRYLRAFEGIGIDVDVFPYTRQEWARRGAARDMLWRAVHDGGIVLCGSDGTSPPVGVEIAD